MELVPQNRVLSERDVRLAQQDEDSFNVGSYCLLEGAGVGDIKVDAIVDIDSMWSRCGVPVSVLDTLI